MRFEERPDEAKFEAAYRALGELRIALRAIAYRQPNTSARATLERVAESHLGAVEQLVKSDHIAYLRKAPPPRLLVTDEDKRRDPKLSEALARLPQAPEESTWKADENADEFQRRLKEAMIEPTGSWPRPAVLRLNPGEPTTITLEEAHRRLRELGQDPADHNGVLIIPADLMMVDQPTPPVKATIGARCPRCGMPTKKATEAEALADCPERDYAAEDAEALARSYATSWDPELPADPTGVDCPERYESPGDQA